MNKSELIKKFKALKVPEPEEWANSQIEEGINQYSRAKALSLLFEPVQKYADNSFIDAYMDQEISEEEPYGLLGGVLCHMVKAGISKTEINYFIRCIQVQYIGEICSKMDGCGAESPTDGICLCDRNEDAQTVEYPDGLHESVFEVEGNDMVPPPKLVKEILKVIKDHK